MNKEQERLETIASETSYTSGIGIKTNQYAFEIIRRYLRSGHILEVGAAEGALSEKLISLGQPVSLLDASKTLCEGLQKKFPSAEIFNALAEDFAPDTLYENIVLSHVLEHVADPDTIISHISSWLAPQGRLFAFVPNAMSIHRQIGTMLDLLPAEDALNETDKRIGHRRVFNPISFRRCMNKPDLKILHYGGYWLKPLSDSQIERDFSAQALDAFLRLGEHYPDIAAEIYIIAEKR